VRRRRWRPRATLCATARPQRQLDERRHVGYETVRTQLRRLAGKRHLDTAARAAVVAAARERGLLAGDDPHP